MTTTADAILVGTTAMSYFIDPPREPSDVDYASCLTQYADKPFTFSEDGVRYEVLFNPVLFQDEFEHRLREFDGEHVPVLDLDGQLTLKLSHAVGWPINWEKHVYDIQWLVQHDARVDWPLFYELHAFWNDLHGEDKRSDLDMNADAFFDNAIEDSHGHDRRHEVLSAPLDPAYKQMLVGEVLTDMGLFDKMPAAEKLRSCNEEVMVMAWERHRQRLSERDAYLLMLKNYILRHAPLEQAAWMILNYIDMREVPKPYYSILDTHKESLK